MRYSKLKNIIKNHNLRATDCRIDVLGYFVEQEKAVSVKDLEQYFPGYDRVTLYRTLHSFNEHGLVHKIPDDTGFVTYGLCHSCTSFSHNHNHVHFKCRSCGKVECIEGEINLPKFSLPKDYRCTEIDVIMNGTCGECNG